MADCEEAPEHYGVTPNVCLPFPEGTAPIDIAGDIKKLAEAADKALEGKFFPGIQYPPDLDGYDGHVVASNVPLTWDMLPTPEADNGSLLLIDDAHPLYKVYEFDVAWDNSQQPGQPLNQLVWLIDVLQFRGNQLANGSAAFYYMPAPKLTAMPDLDTSNLTNMSRMFQYATNFNQDISGLDTSNVLNGADMNTGMGVMFYQARAFDQDISGWCVNNITSKPQSFDDQSGFAGQDDKQPNWGAPC